MFHIEGEIVKGLQCVRTSRSLGNANNLDLWADVPRVGLPTFYTEIKLCGPVNCGISSKCQDIGGGLSVLQILQTKTVAGEPTK